MQEQRAVTWSVGEQASRQSSAALQSLSPTHAKICGPHLLIMRAMVSGPDALRLSSRFTCTCASGHAHHSDYNLCTMLWLAVICTSHIV